jgi:RNA-binding protein
MTKRTGKQKSRLKSLAHHMKPVVYIGKNGITASLLDAVDTALAGHELIKIKFIDYKDEKVSCLEEIVSRSGA